MRRGVGKVTGWGEERSPERGRLAGCRDQASLTNPGGKGDVLCYGGPTQSRHPPPWGGTVSAPGACSPSQFSHNNGGFRACRSTAHHKTQPHQEIENDRFPCLPIAPPPSLPEKEAWPRHRSWRGERHRMAREGGRPLPSKGKRKASTQGTECQANITTMLLQYITIYKCKYKYMDVWPRMSVLAVEYCIFYLAAFCLSFESGL